MDFFQAQDDAHRKTGRLVLFYAAAVVCIVLAVYGAVTAGFFTFYHWANSENFGMAEPAVFEPVRFLVTMLLTVSVIASGSLFKIMQLRSGGGFVARSLGGREIQPGTGNKEEKRLFNVVEEMAIASGVPMPEVYVLEHESCINAFAAGYSIDDAAVAFSQGALEHLSRDELQGVAAHEFSHILNGDMRMNTYLSGVLHGILMLTIVGRALSAMLDLGGGSRYGRRRGGVYVNLGGGSRSGGNGKGGGGAGALILAVIVVIVLVTVIGYIGSLFARMIQASISRQREYLADASAVQFTRNPEGIAGALSKIGGLSFGSRIEGALASETAHMFFGNALDRNSSVRQIFGLSTHPPLPERIRRVWPEWNGEFKTIDVKKSKKPSKQPSGVAQRVTQPVANLAQGASVVASIGTIQGESLKRAHALLARIPEKLKDAAHDPERAPAIIITILLSADSSAIDTKLSMIEGKLGVEIIDAIRDSLYAVNDLQEEDRYSLVEISLSALARCGRSTLEALDSVLLTIIRWDNQVDTLEYILYKSVRTRLKVKIHGAGTPSLTEGVKRAEPIAAELSMVLSAISWAGARSPEQAKANFAQCTTSEYLLHNQLTFVPEAELDYDRLDEALDRVREASFAIRRQLIDAAVRCIALDGKLEGKELALVRVFCGAIGCPMPR